MDASLYLLKQDQDGNPLATECGLTVTQRIIFSMTLPVGGWMM